MKGPAKGPALTSPAGIAVQGERIFVADPGAHAIFLLQRAPSGTHSTVALSDAKSSRARTQSHKTVSSEYRMRLWLLAGDGVAGRADGAGEVEVMVQVRSRGAVEDAAHECWD